MSHSLIYLVEDDEHICQLLNYNLEAAGYKVKSFTTGEALLKEAEASAPDMFILDVMLPGIDGLDVCKQLKSDFRFRKAPIIMLTAKSEELDKVLGLEIGADDYITKPFSIRELTARVKALFRRSSIHLNEEDETILKYYNLVMDINKHIVQRNSTLIELSNKEFELLRLLIKNKGRVLTRDTLLDKVWGYDYIGETRTVDVHVHFLRQKLEENGNEFIETVRGIGYRLKDL